MKETIFGMKVFDMALVPTANISVLGCMTYAAPSHKEALKMFWLHLRFLNVYIQSILRLDYIHFYCKT